MHDSQATAFRIYVLRDDEPHELCSTSRDGLGLALATMVTEGEITGGDRVGILYRPDEERPGLWLVNPWAVGR